ncbi:MAG: (d)CMP kinase [Clostridia bacterium]
MGLKAIRIAVDGPAGAGKSTVARAVARRLHYHYIDTGAMYRALAWRALNAGVDLRDEQAVTHLLEQMDLGVVQGPDQKTRVLVDGEDVSERIRTPEVHASVSLVAGYSGVRAAMTRRQRELAQDGGVVMDGRDIGTHVLPDAEVKVFLTATLEVRVARRQAELRAQGYDMSADRLREDIEKRDRLDMERAVAPLREARDALHIDTSDLPVDAVVERILDAAAVAASGRPS